MNKAPLTTTGDSDLSRWAKGIGADADHNSPNHNNDLQLNRHGSGTSAKLKPKYKRSGDGFYIDPDKGPNYSFTASYDVFEVVNVATGQTYRNTAGTSIPADVGSFVCIKPIPPESNTYWQAVTLYDSSPYIRTGSAVYYPQSTGNQYWMPLGGGGSGISGDVWL